MVGRTTLVIIVVSLLFGALIPFNGSNGAVAQSTNTIGSHEAITKGTGSFEITYSYRGTFLCADPFEEGRPEGGSDVEAPAIVDLRANGILEETTINITWHGQVCVEAYWDNLEPVYHEAENGIRGVFSSDSQLRPINELNRVPGAIDYGKDVVTAPTYFDKKSTDIPQDFIIEKDGELSVPRGANYLFICFQDTYYPDNVGTIQITIKLDKDTDGDGLLDSWEQNGIDFDHDSNIDLDLPALGADWEHKDIFVEADYMDGNRPDPEALEDVEAAFSNAQVSNPDNIKGINLHVLLDEGVPWKEFIGFADYYTLKNKYLGTQEERLNNNSIQAKKMVYRYCLFANKLSINGIDARCPGVAEGIVCDDFILAFGAFPNGVGSREDQAAVFMHELGHTLGLDHGGNTPVNYKPNYLSIMNYAFQYNILVPTRPLDYSYGDCIDLNESKLDEFNGIGQAKATVWKGTNNTIYRHTNGMPIDWEFNGWIDNRSVKMNVNNHDGSSPPGETLKDFNDWANLVYKFRGTPLSAASAFFNDYHIELTTEQIEQMRQDAANIIVVDSPMREDSSSGLPMVAILGVGAIAILAVTGATIVMMRRRK